MGSLFRSHAMTMVQIIDHNDGAREVVELLGELGVMQLVDLGRQRTRCTATAPPAEEGRGRKAAMGVLSGQI